MSEDVVRRYFETMAGREWEAFGQLVAEDVVYEMPQSTERISGRESYVRFNQEYPGDWKLEVTRLVIDGDRAAASMNFTVGEQQMVGLVFLEVTDGLISRVTDFWPEPYEAPPGREHLTEVGVVGTDRFAGF